MTRSLKRMLLAAVVFPAILLSSLSPGQSRRPPQLRVTAAEDGGADPFPASRYYVGTLVNDGQDIATIEAIQMPGGYLGNGRVFACTVQIWNAKKHAWRTPHVSNLAESYRDQIIQVAVPAGEALQVCKNLLPQQAGHRGDLARFALALKWAQPPAVFSKPFKIGKDPGGNFRSSEK